MPEVFFARASVLAPASPQPSTSEAARTWALIKDSSNVSVLEAFAKQFGGTVYSALARARIEELKKRQVAVASSPKAPAPAPGQLEGPLADWVTEMRAHKIPDVAPHFLVVALCPGCSNTAFYCRAPIASVADLKGKTVGIASNRALSSQLQGVGATVIPYKAMRNVTSDLVAELFDCAAFQK
jgi:hypothetical protein